MKALEKNYDNCLDDIIVKLKKWENWYTLEEGDTFSFVIRAKYTKAGFSKKKKKLELIFSNIRFMVI